MTIPECATSSVWLPAASTDRDIAGMRDYYRARPDTALQAAQLLLDSTASPLATEPEVVHTRRTLIGQLVPVIEQSNSEIATQLTALFCNETTANNDTTLYEHFGSFCLDTEIPNTCREQVMSQWWDDIETEIANDEYGPATASIPQALSLAASLERPHDSAVTSLVTLAEKYLPAGQPYIQGDALKYIVPFITEDRIREHCIARHIAQPAYDGYTAFTVEDPIDRHLFRTFYAEAHQRGLIGEEAIDRIQQLAQRSKALLFADMRQKWQA